MSRNATPGMHKKAFFAAVLSLAFSAGAFAQASPAASATPAPATPATAGAATAAAGSMNGSTLASADRKFIHNAALGGMAEVELGKLAQQKAASDEVKQFGSRMVQDHSKANDELKQIADAKGAQVPTNLDSKNQKTMQKLQKLDGAAFDRAYMKDMVADHKKDIAEFQKASKSAKDSDLKAFAAKTLPVLKEHLQMAEAAEKTVRSSKAGSGNSGNTAGHASGSASSSSKP